MQVKNCEKCCCDNANLEAIPVEAPNNVNKESLHKRLVALAKRLQPVVELICRIALAIFACVINFKLFAIAAGVGAAAGVLYTVYKNIVKDPIEVGLARPSCAQGFFDYLSGIRCPPLVSTVITAVFIGGHMHHSPFFIGFCGVPFGVWAGTQVTQIIWNLTYRDIYPMKAPLKNIGDIFAPLPRDHEIV